MREKGERDTESMCRSLPASPGSPPEDRTRNRPSHRRFFPRNHTQKNKEILHYWPADHGMTLAPGTGLQVVAIGCFWPGMGEDLGVVTG